MRNTEISSLIFCGSQHYPEMESNYFQMGDIIWAKIGKYPFWPSIISEDPDSKQCIKEYSENNHNLIKIHVQFFNDNNKRSWVKNVYIFSDTLDIISKYPHYLSYFKKKNYIFIKWSIAIQQAQVLCQYNRKNRIQLFNTTNTNRHKLEHFNKLINPLKYLKIQLKKRKIEAIQAHNNYISMEPPKFIPIKINNPCGNVKLKDIGDNDIDVCNCDPMQEDPCGPNAKCLNRTMMFECDQELCPAGKRCNNQQFKKQLCPTVTPFLTRNRGWGLKTLSIIKEGSFIIEYVGDLIDRQEFNKRINAIIRKRDENHYFFHINKNKIIDAGSKGNLSRFMNHSCEPNCIAYVWIVNCEHRVGFFALDDIEPGTELVFDYNFENAQGVTKIPCQCGAAKCCKFIGV